jgi:sulfur carrier protein
VERGQCAPDMNVTVNGERREIPEGLNVIALLEHLGMRGDRVAIERNLDILPRAQWQETRVQPNDSFEIVQFVGGGELR